VTKRILIIRPDKIGDLVLTLPMATVIKEHMHDAEVAFLVRDYTAPLAGLCPDIDEVVLYDRNSSLRETVALIRRIKPDAIFIFGHKLKLTVASFIARVPIRVGRAFFWFSFLYNKKIFEHRKNAERNEAEYNVRMLKAIGIATDITPLPNIDRSLLPESPLSSENYFVLHILTGGSSPGWSEENFIQIAQWITAQYQSSIILTGLPADDEYLLRIQARMKQYSENVIIHTHISLGELAALLGSARLVISGGTGPGHLAAALGTPTIGIFPGVTAISKERWGFRGKNVKNLSPNTMPKNECPNCKDCTCIDQITVAEVTNAIQELHI
jgi:heptosyltransferase-2